jgi:hypothetical protein
MEEPMAITLRTDERQWLRYRPEETVPTMRAAEAWSMRVAGAFLIQRADLIAARSGSVTAGENARHIGEIMTRISDARLDYLGSIRYDVPIESKVAASSFDAISRLFAGDESLPPGTVEAALDTILASMFHIDSRTMDAGFLHPTRLESILTRGDA